MFFSYQLRLSRSASKFNFCLIRFKSLPLKKWLCSLFWFELSSEYIFLEVHLERSSYFHTFNSLTIEFCWNIPFCWNIMFSPFKFFLIYQFLFYFVFSYFSPNSSTLSGSIVVKLLFLSFKNALFSLKLKFKKKFLIFPIFWEFLVLSALKIFKLHRNSRWKKFSNFLVITRFQVPFCFLEQFFPVWTRYGLVFFSRDTFCQPYQFPIIFFNFHLLFLKQAPLLWLCIFVLFYSGFNIQLNPFKFFVLSHIISAFSTSQAVPSCSDFS